MNGHYLWKKRNIKWIYHKPQFIIKALAAFETVTVNVIDQFKNSPDKT